jgi:hypothetical protein
MADVFQYEGTIDHMTPGARQFSFGLEGKNAAVHSGIKFVRPLRPSEIKVKKKLKEKEMTLAFSNSTSEAR